MPDTQRNQGPSGQDKRQGQQHKEGDRSWPDPNEKGLGSGLPQDRERTREREEQDGENTGNKDTR